MAFDIRVSGTSISGITVTGGRVVLQEWPGILAKTYEVALPRLVASSWPGLNSVSVPRSFSVGLLLEARGSTPDAAVAAWHSLFDAVAAAVETTGTVILTRTRDLTAGTQTRTASAVYLGGMEPTMLNAAAGKCVPRWQLLGEWA